MTTMARKREDWENCPPHECRPYGEIVSRPIHATHGCYARRDARCIRHFSVSFALIISLCSASAVLRRG